MFIGLKLVNIFMLVLFQSEFYISRPILEKDFLLHVVVRLVV